MRSESGLSNSRLKGLNSRHRVISHRSFGFHSAEPLIALISLSSGRIRASPHMNGRRPPDSQENTAGSPRDRPAVRVEPVVDRGA
jgi:hypothetical protein